MIELAPSVAVPEDVALLYRDTSGIVSAVAWAVYERLNAVAVDFLPMVGLDPMHPEAHDTSTEGSYTRTVPVFEDTQIYGYERVYPDGATIEFWRNVVGRRQNEVALWLYAPLEGHQEKAPRRDRRRRSSDLLGIANSGLVYANNQQIRLGVDAPDVNGTNANSLNPADLLRTDAQAVRVAACILEATSSGWDFDSHHRLDLMTALSAHHNALVASISTDQVTPHNVQQLPPEVPGIRFIDGRVHSLAGV